MPLTEIGLLVLYVCSGAAAVVLAHSALVRVQQLGREGRDNIKYSERVIRLKEREADHREQEIANETRALDLREREVRLEEEEARQDREDDDF